MSAVVLLDEHSPQSVRAVIGSLLEGAASADFAVARIRLGALDFSAGEVGGVRRCRVLLGRLDVGMLAEAGDADGGAEHVQRLEVLTAFASSGRLEVRAAGLGGWVPDFSVFRGARSTALVGAHYFGAADPVVGPSFTTIIEHPDALALLHARFEELWRQGHDVLPAIRDVLERGHALALDAAGRRGGPDRADAAG